MIHVLALIVTRPGLRSQVLDLFKANCPAVLAEDGCIEYQATIDAAGMPTGKGTLGEDTFVVVEKWESLAALQAHAASPHMAAYGQETKEMVASRTIHVLEPV
ncbi:putative quinol monooxygenase YgiN [Burkholderiales bacterium 8X]|nr:putative quinol monooxygenase YgiN [Burkholderiales bacterium 8X]